MFEIINPPTLDSQALDQLRLLFQRAEQGDLSALPELRQAMADYPGLWEKLGDLSVYVEDVWKHKIAGPNLALREAISCKLAEMRQELLGAGDSLLERLLVERILACWLQLEHVTVLFGKAQTMSAGQLAMLEKRQNGAQQRYLQSIKSLAMVRKLVKPPLSPLELLGSCPAEPALAPTRRPILKDRQLASAN